MLRGSGCHLTPANATRIMPVTWPPLLACYCYGSLWKQTCQPQCSALGSGKPQWQNQFPGIGFWAVTLNPGHTCDTPTTLAPGACHYLGSELGLAVSTSRNQASPAQAGAPNLSATLVLSSPNKHAWRASHMQLLGGASFLRASP